MWNDFTDLELVRLASNYGLDRSIVFAANFTLANRPEMELLLTQAEYILYFNSKVAYN